VKSSMYLYGKNSVSERINANPKSIKQIFLTANFASPHIIELMGASNIPSKRVTEKEFQKIKRADRAQGIIAEVTRFNYTPYDELLNNEKYTDFTIIFLDNISDPHNLGSIIRTTACLGKFAVVLPRHSSCEVNDTVMHVASGGENFTPVSVVNNTSTALIKAKKSGRWIVGTAAKGGESIEEADLPFPLCVVLGSEGKGIRPGVRKQLDMNLTLPMKGAKLSFNVAISCAMICYEISRRK